MLSLLLLLTLNHTARAESLRPSEAPPPAYSFLDRFRDSMEAGRSIPMPAPEEVHDYLVRETRSRAPVFRENSTAAQCPNQNFAAELGPVRNQGGLGWCFASVAADFLSWATGRRVSDVDLGVQYFHVLRPGQKNRYGLPIQAGASITEFWGGSPENLINLGANLGVCSEDDVNSGDFLYDKLETLAKEEGKASGVKSGLVNDSLIKSIETFVGQNLSQMSEQKDLACEAVNAAQQMFPKLNSWQAIAILSSSRSNEEAFNWLLQQGCARKPPRLPPNYAFRHIRAAKDAKYPFGRYLRQDIDEALSARKPVFVALFAKRYFAGTAKTNLKENEVGHAASLVAREFRNGRCEYLVRGSGGPNCAQYAKPYGDPKNCERGQFWISEKDLNETVFEAGMTR